MNNNTVNKCKKMIIACSVQMPAWKRSNLYPDGPTAQVLLCNLRTYVTHARCRFNLVKFKGFRSMYIRLHIYTVPLTRNVTFTHKYVNSYHSQVHSNHSWVHSNHSQVHLRIDSKTLGAILTMLQSLRNALNDHVSHHTFLSIVKIVSRHDDKEP